MAADPEPPGIGGAYTITAGGERIIAMPLAATGVYVPAGIPVRVRVSGMITRKSTAGLHEFCALPRWAEACATTWAEIVAETPIGPGGPSFWPGAGAAIAAWDGGAPGSPPVGGQIALSGMSGNQLYAGRGEWGCYYVDDTMRGVCFNFGGGFTFTVEGRNGSVPGGIDDEDGSDDGGGGGGGAPPTLAATAARLPDGTVSLSATTMSGATIESPRWTFVPDVVSTVNGDTTPAANARAMAMGMPARAAEDVVPMAPGRWRLPDGRIVGAGLHLVRFDARRGDGVAGTLLPSAQMKPNMSVSSSLIELDSCDDLVACTTIAQPANGSYVVVATLGTKRLTASARIGSNQDESFQLECPASAVRAQEILCRVSGATPPVALAVSEWSFKPDDSKLPKVTRTNDIAEHTWGGPLVASGTVSVTATVGGKSVTKEAHIIVEARAWSDVTVSFQPPTPTDADDMSEQPYQVPGSNAIPDLGHIHFDADIVPLGTITVVPSGGPNAGLGYFTGIPVRPRVTLHINLSQLTHDSQLARRHPESRPAFESQPTCLRSQFPTFVKSIGEHEGTTMHPKSHAGRYEVAFNAKARAILEPMVVTSNISPLDAALEALEPAFADANRESNLADEDFRWNPGCNLNLFPAPKKGS